MLCRWTRSAIRVNVVPTASVRNTECLSSFLEVCLQISLSQGSVVSDILVEIEVNQTRSPPLPTIPRTTFSPDGSTVPYAGLRVQATSYFSMMCDIPLTTMCMFHNVRMRIAKWSYITRYRRPP